MLHGGLSWWFSGKESTCQSMRCRKLRFDPWVGKIPWRRKWQPTAVFLSAGGLQSIELQRVGHDLVTKSSSMLLDKNNQQP